MQTQNYQNHRRYVPLYTFVLSGLITLIVAGAVWNFYRAYDARSGRLSAALIFALAVVSIFFYIYARAFALRAQDRAIRAEESLRYFILAGKPIDPRLRMGQIIALRFASDAEFVALADKAANENMRSDDIKKAIQNWRADHYRA